MSGGRVPLFCDTALARRIEQAEAQLIAEASQAARRRPADTAGFVIPVAGGVASFAEHGSPFNKVAGLGFGGVPSAADLEDIERAFAVCGAPVQIELAQLGDPTIGALLTERGYQLRSFENVLGRALTGNPEPVTPPGIEVRPSSDEEFGAWVDVPVKGGLHPDTQGVPQHEQFPREVLARESRPPCCPRGSPTPQPPTATSRSSPRHQAPNPSRTRNARASTCSIPEPFWSSNPEPAHARPSPASRARSLPGRACQLLAGGGRPHGRRRK